MHVAIVSHIFYPDKGDPFGAFELAKRLAARGHQVSILTWNMSNRSPIEKVSSQLTIYRLAGYNLASLTGSLEFPLVLSLKDAIVNLRPDIIHAHSHLFPTTLQAIVVGKSQNIPVVVTVHGVYARRGVLLNLAQKTYLNLIGRIVFRHAAKVVCLTNSDASEIRMFGCSPEKISIIPNAIDIDMFRPSPHFDNRSIIWVGRFVQEKGVEDLLQATRLVSRQCRDARLILVGDGPLRKDVEQTISRLSLGESVILKGVLSKDQIREVLANALIFVLPSLKEGLPLALLEAMSSGKAVVAYNIPGVNEVIEHEHNGILVPIHDFEKLAEAMVDLLSNRNKAVRLGENARTTIQTRFVWDNTIQNLEQLYGSCKR